MAGLDETSGSSDSKVFGDNCVSTAVRSQSVYRR